MENKMTNTTPILELWKAMGEAGIQPEEIRVIESDTVKDEVWMILSSPEMPITISNIDDPDSHWWEFLLYILTGHAETWLRVRGWHKISWNHYGIPDSRSDSPYAYNPLVTSLPDALRAETGRECK